MRHTTKMIKRNKTSDALVCRWVEGGNIAYTRALSHSSYQAILVLDDMRRLLNSSYFGGKAFLRAVPIVGPENGSEVKNVKQFCGGLLDRCHHPWKLAIRSGHLSLRLRLSIASSIFSVRKLLGSSKPCPRLYAKQMGKESPPLDREFAAFCKREVERMFEQGWDRGYWNQVATFTPPTKSNRRKKQLGTYRELAAGDEQVRKDFLVHTASGKVHEAIDRRVRATAVDTGGKWRVITLSDHRLSHLLPLHHVFYNRLSKEKWLLRGEATESAFKGFERVRGEKFVSGDYESATDNLNIWLSRLMLRTVLSRATHVPTGIRDDAMDSLSMTFVDNADVEICVQRKGQLMGNPLSFPLLCLANYLTFRYAVRRSVPVRINGDDIVFRATQPEVDSWFSFVGRSGLVVSASKTLVSSRCFSLNSTYFLSTHAGALLCPHFRSSAVQKKCEDMGALAGRVMQIKRDLTAGAMRNLALKTLLTRNLHVIYPAQGSFERRYSVHIPSGVLRMTGLDDRESFYQGLPDEPNPLPKYQEVRQQSIPLTWKKESLAPMKYQNRVPDDEVAKTMVDRAWTEPIIRETKEEYWSRVRDKSRKYIRFGGVALKIYAKLNKVKFVPSLRRFPEKQKIWTKESEGAFNVPVAFVLGGVVG